ncbi:MAG: hypothetical protein CMG63_04485 [Candidatus Marinimicrobia bacterium]|nr:hypothetical protein [Candidatus Neomarinimicrobiota bacterium]|tara:strand:+ start:173 stop:1135 length:963 start_codon:yes stop_codon:yes gene_type:complete
MGNIFCHIGNPKTFSTSIQLLLENYSKNDEINYLGFCPSQKIGKWFSDSTISNIFDYSLMYESITSFNSNKYYYISYFQKQIEKCNNEKLDLWISSENLSCRFILEELDPLEKFSRIQKILPSQTTFIIFFRNIFDSLMSIYSEYIKRGYVLSFEEFCQETYLHRNSNFLQSFIPNNFIETLKSELKNNNSLHAYLINDKKSVEHQLTEIFQKIYNFNNVQIPRKNVTTYNDEEFRIYNKNQKSLMTSSGMIEMHRAFWSLRDRDENQKLIWSQLKNNREIRKRLKESRGKKMIEVFENTELAKYLLKTNDRYILECMGK